jgi:hypothetical protein
MSVETDVVKQDLSDVSGHRRDPSCADCLPSNITTTRAIAVLP